MKYTQPIVVYLNEKEQKKPKELYLEKSVMDGTEGVGFGPTVPLQTRVFKTRLNHSTTPPNGVKKLNIFILH